MTIHQESWICGALADYLNQEEQALYDNVVSDIFGFNALQFGMLDVDFLKNARIPNRIRADVHSGDLNCESTFLPFPANSIDLYLLPHTLDFSSLPQQTLREAERVLVPEGYLVLTGISPMSLWGLRRAFHKKSKINPGPNVYRTQSFDLIRIRDWLGLLGFEIVNSYRACYRLPIQNQGWSKRLRLDTLGAKFIPLLGGVYCIVAKKRVLGMRVIKPNWNKVKVNSKFVTTTSQKDELRK